MARFRYRLIAWLSGLLAVLLVSSVTGFINPVTASASSLAYDATGPGSTGAKCANCTSLSWTHTDAGNALLVAASVGKNGDSGFSATATYNGTAMALLKTVHNNNQPDGFLDVFGMVNPPTGAHTVKVTVSGGTALEVTGGSESFTGAASTNTFGTPASAYGYTTTPTVATAGSTPGGIIAGFASNGSAITSATSPSTSRFIANQDNGSGAGNTAGATSPSTGSPVTMKWTVPSDYWSAVAVEVNPSTGVQAPPAVVTQAASGVTSTAATLNGTVNPNGAATTEHFEYGATSAYGTQVPVPDGSAGSGTSAVPETANLTGLTPSTTYHYRLDATNSSGTSNGSDMTFTTSATTTLTNRPAQAASIVYGAPGANGQVIAYAHPGGLVVAGRDNYQDQVFKDVSSSGGTVLIYLDTVINNSYGRYHDMLINASACGPAVPLWPGNFRANQWGYLNDFRVGGVEQSKLHCVLEAMVAENPHMAGWFADDLGSRSWFPNINWSAFPDQSGYRAGAIALAQTFRQVADEHGLVFIVNGTWSGGTLASNGGGYPNISQSGLSLADGGFVEHHDTEISYFGPYGCASQWATASAVTHGVPFMYAVTNTSSGQADYVNSNCYAYVNTQTSANYDYAPPWGSFHPTGLPSRVAK